VRDLVSSEVDAFLAHFQSFNPEEAYARGAYLARIGLADEALLRTGQVLRQFFILHSADGLGAQAAEQVEEYLSGLVRGYVRTREGVILEEQEHIRSALQHTLHRYTLQLETAAEVARTAISTLELGALLTTAVDLIGERFGLDYVAIYLLDGDDRYAELRAATGLEGRIRLASRHRLKANGASTVGRCLASKRHVLVMARGDESARIGASWLADTQSEIVLPLITHNKVIGALSAQSKRSGAFSSQDVTGFQIMSDQLANAIENARLYADAQRRAEDLAQAYEQLKELEVLKDQFMQNVSHELRTPLTMIRGYAEYMLGGEMGAVDAEQQEALHVILRNSEALSELVADILAMLEISATKTTLTAISLVETVEDSLAGFQIVAAKNGIALNAELPACDGCCLVTARTDHLRRITDNLLGNALKFTPAGGQVTVRLWEGEHRVHLEIADTGIGIPSHLQERIFERFFQVDSSQRRAHGGAGLGLALVKELVESYGGSVSTVSPGKDQGSTFTVVLPRAVV
jgi:signal transduction histidine kinase